MKGKYYWEILLVLLFSIVLVSGCIKSQCGNNKCEAGEDCTNCMVDCDYCGQEGDEIRYLTFQIFVSNLSDPSKVDEQLSGLTDEPLVFDRPMGKNRLDAVVGDLVNKIGTTGQNKRKLGFFIGPITMDLSDEDIKKLIKDAFGIAEKYNIAVGIHLDDNNFWGKRKELWSKNSNVEWKDWEGTPSNGRLINWGTPWKLAPQMCYNSEEIINEVDRLSKEVIGKQLKEELNYLDSAGKSDLFAGVIVGWESHVGAEYDYNQPNKREEGTVLGYCALTNAGYSKDNPPSDFDDALKQEVRSHIGRWAKGLIDSGIPSEKLYSHTAFLSEGFKNEMGIDEHHEPLGAGDHFGADTAFAPYVNPGWSTYSQNGYLLEEIYELVGDDIPWASSEGSAASGNKQVIEYSIEVWLAKRFNHGAKLVNMFAWVIGDTQDPHIKNTKSDEAIRAYRKFLSGENLSESG